MPHRIAFLLTGAAWAAVSFGQTPAPPGVPGAGTSPGATTPVEIAPTGSELIRRNPASPLPNPDLASGAAFPAQRGFIRDAEPFFIYPFLGVGVGYNDNLTGVPSDRISSAFLVVSPRVRADVKTGGDTYVLTYSGNYGHYFSSSANDFNEHAVVATSSNQFTARADLQAAAFYLVKQDPGGSVDRAFTGTPDRWNGAGATATFGYGAPSAQGRGELDLGVTDKRYQNNREITEAFDVSTWNVGARFFYRIAPNTRLLAEIRHTEYDYRLSSSPLDSSEQRYLLGATWDLTAATSGTVKVGYITKRFKQEGLDDYAGPTAEAALRWLPRTYSAVDIFAQYAPSDSTGAGNFTVDKSVGAKWEHQWKSYFLTRALGSYVKSDFQGVSRTDHISRVSIGAYFDVRTWLRLGAELSHENRNSTDTTFDFSRNVVLLTIAGTL
jgi:polysaccharide biosynthesis protein VpsM